MVENGHVTVWQVQIDNFVRESSRFLELNYRKRKEKKRKLSGCSFASLP